MTTSQIRTGHLGRSQISKSIKIAKHLKRIVIFSLLSVSLLSGGGARVAAETNIRNPVPSPNLPTDCGTRLCGQSPSGSLCGVCPPQHTCGTSATCVRVPIANCSTRDWLRACSGWNTAVAASAVCAAAVSACLGITGGPIAGPACKSLAMYGGCVWSLTELQTVLDKLQQCTDYHMRCSAVNDPTRPLMCDPRGTPGASIPQSYCNSCCLMAYPFHRNRGRVISGPNDAKRAQCVITCNQLGISSIPPQANPLTPVEGAPNLAADIVVPYTSLTNRE